MVQQRSAIKEPLVVPAVSRAERSDSTVAIFYLFAALWLALAIYVAAFAKDEHGWPLAVTTAALVAAVLLHFVLTSASNLDGAFVSIGAMLLLAGPTVLLLIHRSDSPSMYFAYLLLHGTIAAVVVDTLARDSSPLPRWLTAAQVIYVVVLALDTLGRVFPPEVLYPAADLEFFATLHTIADVRVLLLLPIVVAWLIIAIIRSRRDGSFEELPVVWRTEVGIASAIGLLPVRFLAAVTTFLDIIVRRILTDFLYAFRFAAVQLGRYAVTVVAVGAMLIGARFFAPWLIYYLRSPTSVNELLEFTAFVVVGPVVGFLLFLIVPFINAALAALWRDDVPLNWLLQRSYQIAAIAAVPCALIGPLFWLGTRWFDLPGFVDLGIVSIGVLVVLVAALLFGSKLRTFETITPSNAMYVPEPTGSIVDWESWPIAAVGLALIGLLILLPDLRVLAAGMGLRLGRSRELVVGQPLDRQEIRPHQWLYYRVEVPANASRLRVGLAFGQADLYIRHDGIPTAKKYSCKVESQKGFASCVEKDPAAGQWWVAVRGRERSAATLNAAVAFKAAGKVGRPRVAIVATAGAKRYETKSDADGNFIFEDLPAGNYTVKPGKTDCRFSPASREVTVPGAPASFSATCGYVELEPEVTLQGRVALKTWNYYLISVPRGVPTLSVLVEGSHDLDLFTRPAVKPTPQNARCRETTSKRTERCLHPQPEAGEWWIGLWGHEAATYTIRATY